MSVAIVDTTVILHLLRQNPLARQWFNKQSHQLSITPLVWLEVMAGANNKVSQASCRTILRQFEILYLMPSDQIWAMEQLAKYQLSHQVGIHDCLIASVPYRLQLPLYTHNLKDMTPLIGSLAQKPY